MVLIESVHEVMERFRIDPAHLEHDELLYEEAIRAPTGDTPGQSVTLLLGVVRQRMDREKVDGIDPLTIGLIGEAETEAIAEELKRCRKALKGILNQIETQMAVVIAHMSADNAPKIKSRMLHHEYRLKRLPQRALTPQQKAKYDSIMGRYTHYQAYLDNMLQPNEEGYAMLLPDITMSSVNTDNSRRDGTGILNSTAHGDTGTNGRATEQPPESDRTGARNENDERQTTPNMSEQTNENAKPSQQQQRPPPMAPGNTNGFGRAGPSHAADEAHRTFGVTFDGPPSVFQYTHEYDYSRMRNPHISVPLLSEERNLFSSPNGYGPNNRPQSARTNPPSQQNNQNAPYAQPAEQAGGSQPQQFHMGYQRSSVQGEAPRAPMQRPENITPRQPIPPSAPSQHGQSENVRPTDPQAGLNPNGWQNGQQTHGAVDPRVQTTMNNPYPQSHAPNVGPLFTHPQQQPYGPNPNPPQSMPYAGWPPNVNNASFSSVYHPATTPFPYRNQCDPLNLNELPINGRQPIHMNPCQAQQYMSKMLANRKYDGYQADQRSFVALEEFIGLIRQYRFSTGYDDRTILSQVSSFMTGAAFVWWQTNGGTLQSIDEMEARLRGRFERQATDPTSILIEFAQRKQGKDEDLLDFIDEMRQKLLRCGAQMPEQKAIEMIVDNTNETYNRILAARTYNSLNHLSGHAEYLVRGRPRKAISMPRQEKKQTYSRPPRVGAIEGGHEEETTEAPVEEMSQMESEGDTDFVADMMIYAIKSGYRVNRPNNVNRPFKSNQNVPATERVEKAETNVVFQKPVICTNCYIWGHADAMCKEPKKIRCFGCGKEGVYKAQCEVCTGNRSKN